jgi:hypothetical protein
VIEIDGIAGSYNSGGIQRRKSEPYLLPKGAFDLALDHDVLEGNEHQTIFIDFDNTLNDNFVIEVSYYVNGTIHTEVLADNQFNIPKGLEPQAIVVSGIWKRQMVSFNLWVK